jgi:archaellum component FlaC
MANYTSTAQVVLSVNGKQAQQMLSSLEKDAKHLEKQIEKAAKAGDKATMKKLQRELNATQRTMEQLKGSAATCEQVLHRLDKATPRELNKTLKQLKNELNGIERGTAAWDAQIEKIKAVKREIDNVNSAMREQQSLSDRVINWINKWQMALLAVGAAITGLVMAGRKAVNAYAEMEQEMANVRKFTGMSAEEVGALNEEFKKIDTRTPREELNQLAQEAGRLGKNLQEDVLGFVRAADKINVALDDLGSGATLTLSKLTGIFGDEKRLGTEKALLSVGSVINELSQNCSASAPYIAEFASRMGGVGAQAGMTVQQIMGFAAVLDSNNQKLEASSTALSQVIVRIYQDPAKYAKVAGMDVQKFSKLVKTDMNAALIEFLSTLKKAGSMDVLSPMFKDMGENGSRGSHIRTLDTLQPYRRGQEPAACRQRSLRRSGFYRQGVRGAEQYRSGTT